MQNLSFWIWKGTDGTDANLQQKVARKVSCTSGNVSIISTWIVNLPTISMRIAAIAQTFLRVTQANKLWSCGVESAASKEQNHGPKYRQWKV